LVKQLQGHSLPVYGLSWSPDGRRLASASHDCTVRIWTISDGEAVITRGSRHQLGVWSVAWSPDGRWIASGDLVSVVNLWDANNGEFKQELHRHTQYISSIEWSPDGRYLATASDDRTVVLWDGQTFEASRTLEYHRREVTSSAWSSDSRTLATGSLDCTVCIWSPNTGRLKLVLESSLGPIKWVAFSGDDRLLAARCGNGGILVWECDTWEPVAQLTVATAQKLEPILAFNPRKPQLATSADVISSLRVWSVDTGALLTVRPDNEHGPTKYRCAKVVIGQEIKDVGGGRLIASIKDADGNVIGLLQPA
jgi:WD40 repeat protein